MLRCEWIHYHPISTHLDVHSQMRHRIYLLSGLQAFTSLPLLRGRHVRLLVQLKRSELLQQPHEVERRLVVRELLPKADPRASVEGAEDVWVWREVFVQARVEEAVRVECQSWIERRL
jgi:hypothetical protein